MYIVPTSHIHRYKFGPAHAYMHTYLRTHTCIHACVRIRICMYVCLSAQNSHVPRTHVKAYVCLHFEIFKRKF